MTYREALNVATDILTRAGIEDAGANAWYLLVMACNIDRNFYYMHQEEQLTMESKQAFGILLSKRVERIPLQYITGEQEFMGLTFKVNSNVLIPRQDTEVLVEEALKVLKPESKVLDMCTGSGCIIISLAKLKEGLQALGADLSKLAINVAKENAKINQVDVEWVKSDMFSNVEGIFDVIVSNPPYIPTKDIQSLMPEVRDFEPIEALDGSEDGLKFYKILAEESINYLKDGGSLLLEIGYDQGNAVSELLRNEGFEKIEVIQDLAGLDRVVKAIKPEE